MSKFSVVVALLLASAGCARSDTPTSPNRPRFDTGYIGGGGRAAPTDSTLPSAAPATGYIGGGGLEPPDTTDSSQP